jgi:hypothetical protein
MAIRNLPGALYALRIETGISGFYEKRIVGRTVARRHRRMRMVAS